ncbi:hypothetical protein B0H16DRAFT_1582220 [Mycena metata]|uniref:DUF6534 domain-containing protein n=1 Tax=Mycena metata TaxID=1033252 RepID=A0AAD7I240_9AGAR|nr:hypothetical protein B0H16DRAFT_1582220 [Mycena metata]
MGSTYDLTLGCLLVSSWLNMILFTLELNQILKYFTRYKRDPTFNKVLVLIALAGDILTVFACLSATYLYMVSHWGQASYLATQPWCIAGYVIGTGITGGAVQIFLTRMLYTLTKQWVWLPILGLFITVGVAGAGITAGHLIINSSISGREELVKWVTVWLSACIAADTFITTILVVKFQTLKTGFSGTGELLRRLSLAAVRNGSITTAMTIITIVVFKLQPEANTAVMIEIIIGRVYSLCMLSNLNNRSWISDASSGGDPSSKGTPTHRTVAETQTVVRVHQEVDIQMDPLEYGRRKQGDAESLDGASANSYPDAKPKSNYVTF